MKVKFEVDVDKELYGQFSKLPAPATAAFLRTVLNDSMENFLYNQPELLAYYMQFAKRDRKHSD